MIYRALKLIRKYHNIKQKDLAIRLELSASHLSEIEKGTKPVSYELLEKYSQVFRMPVSSIAFFAEVVDGKKAPEVQKFVAGKALKLLEWLNSISDLEDVNDGNSSSPH